MKNNLPEPQIRLKASRQFAGKISYKRKNCVQLAMEIEDYLKENQEGYDEGQFTELRKLQKALRSTGQTIYAVYKNGKSTDVSAAAVIYSKHRFDEVWLYRKSQIIRSRYAKFFANHEEYSDGTYRPCHLVLTVPHTEEKGWKGKEFYGRELVKEFGRMREKWSYWKEYVYAGEYGVEVTKGKHGLHIHIHSLVFVKSEISLNEFRRLLKAEWKRRVCDKEGKGGVIWLETLYYYKRKANGQFETNSTWTVDATDKMETQPDGSTIFTFDGTGTWTEKVERIKCYWHKGWTSLEFLSGVLECIKYHFKMDSVKTPDGSYNIPLIQTILNNSRKMHFYSRYGAFYTEKELAFNKISGSDEDGVGGDTDNFLERMVNPFTEETPKAEDFVYQMARPEKLNHCLKPSYRYIHRTDAHFKDCDGETPKEILTNHFKKKYQ